jgi:hypothetical protein
MIVTKGVGRGAAGIIVAAGLGIALTSPVPPDSGGSSGPTGRRIDYTSLNRVTGYIDDRDLLEIIPIVVEVLNGRR